MSADQMTSKDRDRLAQVARMRARVAKSSIEQRELALRSQVEQELKALFDTEHELETKAIEEARRIASRARDDLTERLDELKVPANLRPQIGVAEADAMFTRHGDTNASRRAALRGLAYAKVKTLGANAKVEIDRQCADTVTALVAGGLSGDDAQRYLDAMPTIDQLMLAPSVAELEAVHDQQRRERLQLGGSW